MGVTQQDRRAALTLAELARHQRIAEVHQPRAHVDDQ